jgi:hypothetical protein
MKLTVTTPAGWGLFWGLVRVGLVVFIGFNAPWYVTALAALLQVRYERKV